MSRATRCSECGSVLRDRPDSCPLCGRSFERAIEKEPAADSSADGYQDRVRALREELRKLRENDAEAV